MLHGVQCIHIKCIDYAMEREGGREGERDVEMYVLFSMVGSYESTN